jgi:hypothetical protein
LLFCTLLKLTFAYLTTVGVGVTYFGCCFRTLWQSPSLKKRCEAIHGALTNFFHEI